MKPNEYVKKYSLSNADFEINVDEFIQDLKIDFNDLIKQFNGDKLDNDFQFEKVIISKMVQKWDSINAKTNPCLPITIWNKFYNDIVSVKINEFFN